MHQYYETIDSGSILKCGQRDYILILIFPTKVITTQRVSYTIDITAWYTIYKHYYGPINGYYSTTIESQSINS